MSEGKRRRLGKALKLEVVRRMEAGESPSDLALEFGINRTIMYYWRDLVRERGEEALRDGPGRPSRLEALDNPRGAAAKAYALSTARRQIAELERKVGQQQADLDFFKRALRHFEETPRPSDGRGETTSSPRSRRRRVRKAMDH